MRIQVNCILILIYLFVCSCTNIEGEFKSRITETYRVDNKIERIVTKYLDKENRVVIEKTKLVTKENFYDTNGDLTKYCLTDNENIDFCTQYVFDERGNEIGTQTENNFIQSKFYDSNDNIIKHEFNPTSFEEYEYDTNNRKVKTIWIEKEDTILKVDHFYNKNLLILEEKVIDDKLLFNKLAPLIKDDYKSRRRFRSRVRYKYDDLNRLDSIITESSAHDFVFKNDLINHCEVYEYDKKSRVLKKTEYNIDGRIQKEIEYQYEEMY